MKTKSLLLAVAASLATTIAFGAVSSNIVGYTQISLVAGQNLVANTLDNGSGNGSHALFSSLPDQSALFTWNGSGFVVDNFSFGAWDLADPGVALPPGASLFVSVPSAASIYFVGQVVQTGKVTIAAGPAYSFVASVLPIAGGLDTALGYVPNDGDAVFTFDASKQSYVVNNYSFGSWDNGSPQIAIGQGIVIQSGASAATTWSQTLPVSN